MGTGEVEFWSHGDDARGVDVAVGEVVVTFDVVEVDRVSNAGLLVEIEHVSVQIRIIHDAPQIALEVPVIHCVEPDEGAEKPPVCLRNLPAKEIAMHGEPAVEIIERLK